MPCLLSGLILLSACQPPKADVPPTRAFYHWQTRLQLSQPEQEYLQSLGVQRLYVRFFDVAWDASRQEAVPLATAQVDTIGLGRLQIVPTIFITNETLQQLSETAVDTLAARISRRIQEVGSPFGWQYPEIQIDCDWTATTRPRYFSLLQALRRYWPSMQTQLSATIRLHQIRYPDQTGVPPVDRGMLMCYNVGTLERWDTENAIFETATAQPYLQGKARQYALPLDIALPAFRWGVLFRNGQLIRLINDLDPAELQDTSRFVPLTAHRFQVKKSTYLTGYYLYRGDLLRLETADTSELEAATALLRRYFAADAPGTIAVYHLDSVLTKRIPYAFLDGIYSAF
ncbi:MAG: hypothetical protein H6555_02325 [Lewinellaceae bacterium]|nr:hypothetical protein [Lewinellaceae bacterium]